METADGAYLYLMQNALDRAAEKGEAKIVTRLLYAAPEVYGVSALIKAVEKGHKDVVRTLILAEMPYNKRK